jgi:NhaP-type Na+/H+ or K+/H+ antiporter
VFQGEASFQLLPRGGPQVINDAVGVVLFNTFAKFVGNYNHGVATVFIAVADFVFIFGGSLVVGYLVGCLAGLGTKCVNFRNDKVRLRSLFPSLFPACFVSASARRAVRTPTDRLGALR